MKEVGAYEAKTHLPQLLEQVAQGETIIITKHGVPVARLTPYNSVSIDTRQKAIRQMLELRTQNQSGGEARAWIKEGRL